MAVDLASKTLAELKTIVQNHERKGLTQVASYQAATAELTKRNTNVLSIERTIELITTAAKAHKYISYKEVADGNGATFNRVFLSMKKHLLEVSVRANQQGWPMLSAIVVNKQHTVAGTMEAATLKGFCACATGLGFDVGDGETFLRAQQAEVFKAAAEGRLE